MNISESPRPIKMLTVANMYPSASDPTYGTFVKNFVESFNSLNVGGSNRVVTIYGRRKIKLSKLITYISYYAKLTKALLTGSYDLIYVHTITFPTPVLRLASLFKKLPLVFNVHGDDVLPSNRFKKLLKHLSRPMLPQARMIVSPSDYFKQVLIDEFPDLNPKRIFVSPSGGLDPIFFISNKKKPNRIPVIGFVSRIDEKKGWDTFLNALSLLKERSVEFKAIIAGNGAQTPLMLDMISNLGLNNQVDYIGAIAHEKLPEVYASFDVFIFPSRRLNESLGLVGLEAMAAGIPVIASNMAGPSGYVINGYNGYLFAPGDASELTARIIRYINLPDEDKFQMIDNAIQTARRFESHTVAANLYRQLQSIV